VVRSIFSYLAAHPVTAPAIPPERGIVQSTTPVALPTTTPSSTTTTTTPGTAGATSTTTTAPGA
jgi:hypothetical protein